jgi:hypothetical protein
MLSVGQQPRDREKFFLPSRKRGMALVSEEALQTGYSPGLATPEKRPGTKTALRNNTKHTDKFST